jgi:hypothetical protein
MRIVHLQLQFALKLAFGAVDVTDGDFVADADVNQRSELQAAS